MSNFGAAWVGVSNNSATRRRFAVMLIGALAAAAPGLSQPKPVAGQNINMVSGTTWPGGDPFLQRQNEPSLAISSRNALHLLAGANDYRTVDLPVSDTVPGSLAGDAWLGVFKSYDGGLSWQSYLLPGYPQDNSAVGQASPLKAYNAAADPTVRAGTGGLMYYSGIAFNRGTNNGAVFVSTFFDTNQKENGNAPAGTDAMQYQRTTVVDTGTSGQFLDKTWIAVDIPRSGAATCSFPGLSGSQSVKAGNLYLVWSRFTGSTSTKIMFSRSLDCGRTWSSPTKLSESSSVNQGTNLAIDPASGKVYAVWRQFATSSNPDSILIARSDDFGKTFPSKNTVQVAAIAPFDQSMTGTRFRTNSLPTVAASVDAGGTSRVHVAWAQRTGSSQDARIVVSTSTDSGKTWSAPAPVDGGTVIDDVGNTFSRGHQFMPQLTYAAGKLMVVYYDQRLDHTLSLFKPYAPFLADASGRFYLRTQALRGELNGAGGTAKVFTLFVDDDAAILTQRRHTIDLRVAEALPASSPSFASASVSQYRMGLWAPDSDGVYSDDEDNPISPQPPDKLYELQVNAPNLPMFSQGTLPFLGDYIDVAGQGFVAKSDGTWAFSTAATPPVFYATWTDNRDVVPPVDPATGLVNWSKYTPPVSLTNAGDGTSHSILDPTQTIPACSGPYTGSRNQNIYLSRITEGLLVGSPQDAKPLFAAPKTRAFIVTLQNVTAQDRTFTLAVAPGPGVTASFLQSSSLASLTNILVGARSGAARPVFASSSNPAGSLTVNVTETTSGCSPCLSGSVVLNPEGSVSPLAQPDGSTIDVGSTEVYTPSFAIWNPSNSSDPNNPNPYVNITDPNQNISNQNISNQNISNADPAIQNISNQNISNQNISNQNISNQNISNPSPAIQNISNQNISNQNISNTTVANQNISNQNISNQNISNAPYSDANYAIVNTGNTAHSYRITLYGNNPYTAPLQIIATKNSQTPVAVGCTLQSLPQSTVLTRADATVSTSLSDATNPNISDGSAANATVSIAPGETVFLTLRGQLTHDQMVNLIRSLSPVVTAHGANTGAPASDFALLLSIQTTGGTTLPVALVGTPYTTTLQASGGKAPLTWTLTAGSALPTGLTLSAAGVISGTPSGSGTFTFTAQVVDSTVGTPQTASQTFSLTVNARASATSIAFVPTAVVVGQPAATTITVVDAEVSGTKVTPSGTVALTGTGLSAASCVLVPGVLGTASCPVTVTPTAPGTDTIGANFPASSSHLLSGATSGLVVTQAATSVVVTSSAASPVFGQSLTLTAAVTVVAPGSGTPTGNVTFFDGANQLGVGALNAGVATLSTSALSVAGHSITAVYAGDGSFTTGTSPVFPQAVGKSGSQTSVASNPNPSVFGQPATFTATVAAVAPGAGTRTGTVTFYDGGVAFGTAAVSAGGTASLATAGLAGGVHAISAVYGGDGNFTGSTSSNWVHTVSPAGTATALASSANPSALGQSVSFTATVTSTAGVPTGTVTFLDGATTLGSAALSAGAGTFSTAGLAAGAHSITAVYGGAPSFLGSTSAALTQTVFSYYTFTGFLSPMATAGTLAAPTFSGTANWGSAQPVKWQLQDASGNYLSDLTTTQVLQAVAYTNGACSGQATGQVFVLYTPTAGAKGGSTFRYDAGSHQFIFNWNTGFSSGPGCYELELTLNDGSPIKATIEKLQ
jgi:hypothetical protein